MQYRKILLAGLASWLVLMSVTWAEAKPPVLPGDEGEEETDLTPARAILQIKSEDGVCYWSISGNDELVRLPQQKGSFSAILLSARFVGDQLSVTLAGEDEPLETSVIGRYEFPLGLQDGSTANVPLLKGARAAEWELSVVPALEKALPGCCTCAVLKVSCCPKVGRCLDCGVCGSCCG